MKQIGEIVPKAVMIESDTSPKNLPERLQNSIAEAVKKYGNAIEFCNRLNPDVQIAVSSNVRRAYMGASPTMFVLKHAFSEEVAESWLMAQIENLNDFCGVQQKMSTPQMESTAKIIIADYYYLKASELMLFFHRFKKGLYGEFYGVVDPQRLLLGLNRFLSDRLIEIKKYEAEAEREARNERIERENENAVSYEEYIAMRDLQGELFK